jgi:hypothetical protein
MPTRLAAFASDHGLPQERFYNLICLAFGADRQEFADAAGYLPPTRSPKCSYEYQTLLRAFHKEISPHINQEMARRVLDTDWLQAWNRNRRLKNSGLEYFHRCPLSGNSGHQSEVSQCPLLTQSGHRAITLRTGVFTQQRQSGGQQQPKRRQTDSARCD